MSFDINAILQDYLNPSAAAVGDKVDNDFDRVAEKIPQQSVADGVTEALRSEQTPPFPELIGQLFGRSDPQQRADMLNQLIAGINPSLLSSLAGGILGSLFAKNESGTKITAEQARQVSTNAVQEIAQRAEQHNPNVVEQMGEFYAQHAGLIKTLGGAALAVVLKRIAQAHSR